MNRRRYEPMYQHTYRIFVNGCLKYASTSLARFRHELPKYAGVTGMTSTPVATHVSA